MKVAICDDMREITQQVEMTLLAYDRELFDIEIFYSPKKLIAHCSNVSYDFFILDIEMPEMSGIDLASAIRELGNQNPIIFLTSYKNYMEDVFKVHTFDYLLKPIQKPQFFSLLKRLLTYLDADEKRFNFTFNKISYSVPFSKIKYTEKNGRIAIIHTLEKEYEVTINTETLLKNLDRNFIQIHQSYIVNLRYILEIKNGSLTLIQGDSLPVGRKYVKEAKKAILTYLRGRV